MPTPLSDAQINAISDALRGGNKIEAIKLYREATGLGLKESKDAVEALEADLRGKFPDQFQPAGAQSAPGKGKGGCLGLVAVLLATGAAGLGWWLTRQA
ncbi:MAG: ribosomal protein L7/L12 [Burkholderiales bacterium]|nr:ribosomal protein L7/L12 [Opitutaceae bacterium]